MKRTTFIRTSLLAVCVAGLGASCTLAQDGVGVARISDRSAPVQQTAFAPKTAGCADAACAETACAACPGEGCCDQSGACAANGACCNGRMRRMRLFSGRVGNGMCAAGGCQPGCNDGSCQTGACQTGNCQNGMRGPGCENGMCYSRAYQRRLDRLCRQQMRASEGGFWTRNSRAYQARNSRVSQNLFGWMVPAGNGGQGSPPVGHYDMVYAENANYADPRDGGIYGAQGYGVHMTVPVAPNVLHQYNYGWGLPSSRITPISNVAPYTLPRPLHW